MILPKTHGRSIVHTKGTTVYVFNFFLLTDFNMLINIVDCKDKTGEPSDACAVIPGSKCTLIRLMIKQTLIKWFIQF